jgi:probable HAF family extracellular repeat protein
MTYTRPFRRLIWLLLTSLFGLCSLGQAQTANCNFKPVSFPGAAETFVSAVTDDLRLVGNYDHPLYVTHGFLLQNGQYTTIDYPGAMYTGVADINARGEIVGGFTATDGTRSGFRFANGTYTAITLRGKPSIAISGINDSDQMVGSAEGIGFLLQNGKETDIVFPGAATYPTRINNEGVVVGFYIDSRHKVHAFTWTNGQFTTIDYPNSRQTFGEAINDAGMLAGTYSDPALRQQARGYIWTNGTFETISRGSQWIYVYDLNNNGVIAGYTTARHYGLANGFIAQCQ